MSEEDSRFIRKMYKDYPDWYGEIDYEVFCLSAPFGAMTPTKEEWDRGKAGSDGRRE